MAQLTGEIRDFGFVGWANREPQMFVVPSGVASQSDFGFLLSANRIPITLTGSNNAFDFFLVGSDAVSPPRPYSFMVRWLDSGGNFTTEDWFRDVWIPDDWDGDVAPLIGQASGGSMMQVIYQAAEPSDWEAPIGSVWVNTVTGDVKRKVG